MESYCDNPYIDAMMWSVRRNNYTENDIIYLFRGSHFWKYNLKTQKLWDERLIRQVWPDVRIPITAISGIDLEYTWGKSDCQKIIIVSRFKYWIYDCKEEYENNQTLRSTGIIMFEDSPASIETLVVDISVLKKRVRMEYTRRWYVYYSIVQPTADESSSVI
ncbi:hypothetical protein B4U79_17411 [Dinothrombium tinctorium]|uniref:Uncharacterized protein n=1 Tax=Dinothrombium tinctorium TaxID=1965070 RepID=A0A443RC35_9ACAR|nr:hypothetical protein B4U79_17411 [Dinothrombium tinctorium]